MSALLSLPISAANRREVKRFVKFAMVGTAGMITHLTLANIFNFGLHFPDATANAIGFITAVFQNYFLNYRWTFGDRRYTTTKSRWLQISQFVIVSIVGLGINAIVREIVFHLMQPVWATLLHNPVVAEVIGYNFSIAAAIAVVLFWNFAVNRSFRLSMPTIAIDYTPAIRQQAGIGRIVRGQIDALIALRPDLDIRLFVVGQVTPDQRAAAPKPLHPTPLSERNMVRLWHRLDSPLPRVEWFTGGPLDLFHATDFVLPPSGARAKLLTVHDLAFLFYPDAAMPSLHHYLNVVVPRSVRRADGLIADSQHTANDLAEQWQVPHDRITVVQGAVDHSRFRPITDATRLAEVRRRYGLEDRPYILALSRLEPRKNFVRLIEAFAQARAEGKLPHRLVIGGKQGWLYAPIYARVQELGLADHVHFPGFIADEDLPAVYSGAAFFAYPSLYEGFGLPIVEALACGLPVLAGDNSCLPEAGGPGALYVRADDTQSIAAGILRLATDAALAAQLAAGGRAHALQFTWERSARQLLSAYEKV